MAAPIKFPLIRQAPQSSFYQPIPVWQGKKVFVGLTFTSQAEAAYASVIFHQMVGLTKPAFEVPALDRDPVQAQAKKEDVEKRMTQWVKDNAVLGQWQEVLEQQGKAREPEAVGANAGPVPQLGKGRK